MAKHFGPQHSRNGFAALGKSRKRPQYPQREVEKDVRPGKVKQEKKGK